MTNKHTSEICNRQGNRFRISTLMLHVILAFGLMAAQAQTVYTPIRYYTFNGANAGTDSTGTANLNFTTYNSQYTVGTGGKVGKFLTLHDGSSLIDGGQMNLTNGLTIEFLIKPGYDFNAAKIIQRGDGAFAVRMEYAAITFSTSHRSTSGSTVNDDFVIQLNGIGRQSYGHYVDGQWHHVVFKFDATTGVKSVWVDGQLPAGFSKTITAGTFTNTGNTSLFLNHSIRYVKYYGGLDELAIYNTAIPDRLIYKHYLGVQNGQPYNYTDNYSGSIPAPSAVTGSFDMSEFAPGHPSVSVSATDQIKTFPSPRYKTGHTLHANVPLYGVEYLGSLLQPGITYTQALNNAKIQQVELINNFNQSILVSSNSHEYIYATDTTKFTGWFVRYGNLNPSKHTSVFTFWPQITPSNIGRASNIPYAMCNCLPANSYLRNSSGQFLDKYGNVTTSNKVLSPAAPLDSLTYDGLTQRLYLEQLTNKMNRPLNLIFENGELIPFVNNSTVLSADPAVLNQKNASGLDWYTYEGRKAKEKVLHYRSQFMNLPALSNTTFAYFQVDGQPGWRFKYSEMRQTHTALNGQYYPTGDVYTRYPYNWRYWTSAWHGWQWVAESRKVELENGDKLYSPPVAAGWDNDETKNIRPAQWLGMLKTFSMTGAEFFYPSFFNISSPYADPKNWAWQTVMPSYAQAVSSRYEDFLRNGYLMEGDVPNDYVNPTWNAFSFKAGDLRKLVVIRKHNSSNKYAITGTLQPNSSWVGNAENSGVAEIKLDGQTIKFNVRRQGSTYIYDKTNASAPVFYQIDGWHEASHPYHWTKDFVVEAELFDNNNSNLAIKTIVAAGSPAGDFTNYTSFVSFNTATEAVYNFLPRMGTPSTQYLWVRARSKSGTPTGFTARLTTGATHTFDCIKDTNWVWYRINTNNAAAAFTGLTAVNQELKFTALNNQLEIDKFHLTGNSGNIYSSVPNPCSTAQATITANGPTSFCQGGNVVLTASSGSSYQWSNGATSQSITVSTSGTYTVTVSGNSVSTPVSVTVNPLPSSTISASGSTTICSGSSVTLTASAGSSYLWSPGNQTTQSITVSSAGSYNVRVTNSNGCSSTSSNTTVTVNSLPASTISANGSTTFCQGGSVTLSASAGSSYLWSPGNQTSQSINVTSSGTYSVRVTNASGCSATSSGTIVTVNSLPTATISASGPLNLNQGQTVTLTASTGSSYLWYPGGQTTKSITVGTSGSYSVRVYNSSGCSALSSAAVVTVSGTTVPATITPSGPTSFCQGGNVTLTANSGSAYLWSTGATSQSITVSSSGNYTVTVTNNGIPSVSSATSVTVWSLPTASITANGATTFCVGSSVTLTANSGTSYSWYPGGQTSQSITVSSAGTYRVTVSNSNGCTATSANTNVTVNSCTTCDKPFGLVTTGVFANSATIEWNNPNTGQTHFQVKLKNMNTGYVYLTAKVTSNITGIGVGANSSTSYRWWVRSWCGTLSSTYAGYLTFTTPSPRTTLMNPLDEEFFEPLYYDQDETLAEQDQNTIQLNFDQVQLFPNPAINEATLSFWSNADEKFNLNITDVNGRSVYNEDIDAFEGFNIKQIETGAFQRGVYMVRITGGQKAEVKRLVLQ